MKKTVKKGDWREFNRFTTDAFETCQSPYIDIEIKPHKKKRSLDANAYCWVLIDKLAEKLGGTLKSGNDSIKETIYKNAIRDIGGVSDVYCMLDKAVDRFVKEWTAKGIGYQCDVGKSSLAGCSIVTAYRGSSSYDTKEMSRLIDSLVQDCKAQGIETMPPNELQSLIRKWGDTNV